MSPLDFCQLDTLVTEPLRQIRNRVRAYMESTVLPAINVYWERAEYPEALVAGLRELDIVGGPIRGYGCPGLSPLSEGLAIFELARVDGSISTFFGVHSGLAMRSIARLGSEEQQQRWLPAMVRLEKIGAFGLTEPERGSDAAHLLTTARPAHTPGVSIQNLSGKIS